MKKYLIIFTSGIISGALIGNMHPTIAFLIGIIFGIFIGYIGSILHMIISKSILEEDWGLVMIKFLKELFCKHQWTITTGTGIYEGKRNHDPLVFHPVMKLKCKKCKYEEDILIKKKGDLCKK